MERSIKELLIILRDNSQITNNQIKSGLCWESYCLEANEVISFSEHEELRNFIVTNMPKNHAYGNWGWKKGLWKPRLKWLNKEIEKLP